MTEFDVMTGRVEGIDSAFVLPTVAEDAPAIVREGLARRRLATLRGECPCGARRPALNRELRRRLQRGGAAGEVHRVAIEHEDDCEAIAPETVAFLRGWRWTA